MERRRERKMKCTLGKDGFLTHSCLIGKNGILSIWAYLLMQTHSTSWGMFAGFDLTTCQSCVTWLVRLPALTFLSGPTRESNLQEDLNPEVLPKSAVATRLAALPTSPIPPCPSPITVPNLPLFSFSFLLTLIVNLC